MKQRGASDQSRPIPLSDDDLRLINNALNEILNGPDAIEDWEFHTRTGAERTEAEALLKRIGALIKRS